MSILQDQKRFQEQSLKENILTTKKPFTRKRIKLDNARNFADTLTDNNYNSAFRAFWVVDSSSKDFKVDMYVNPDISSGDPLPLRHNMNFDFEQIIDGARFEFEAQAGGWIDILFFSVGFGQLGSNEVQISGEVSIEDGSTVSHDNVELSDTPVLVFPSNGSRGASTLFNYSTEIIYIGTEDKINSVDFTKKCVRVPAGGGYYEWKNPSGLYARTAGIVTDDIVILHEGK